MNHEPRLLQFGVSNFKYPFLILSNLLTYLILLPQNSVSQDPYYVACLNPQFCGSLKITYPFYIQRGDQQLKDYICGYPGYQVTCKDNKTAILNLSGDDYVVQKIFYNNQSLHLIHSAFLDNSDFGCKSSLHNLSLDDGRFEYSASVDKMYLLTNCSVTGQKYLTRETNNSHDSNAFNCSSGKISADKYGQYCRSVIEVDYEGSPDDNNTDIEGLVKKGINLKWSAANCSDCHQSGGRCGYNQNISLFQCFCLDRPHKSRCHDHDQHEEKLKKKRRLIIGLGIGVGIMIILGLVFCWYCKRRNVCVNKKTLLRNLSYDPSAELEGGSLYFGVAVFTYKELEEATNSFDSAKELGDGGFGTVYYGKLKDGREVAVKRLYEKNYKRVEQFKNEIEILTRLRHPNLVSLFGCTSRHSRELLLVYEYVSSGTVADHLYGDRATSESLKWPLRMRIAVETANALSYLHRSDIIHRDVKTSNILLDNNFSVKVADFGLSRLFPTDMTHISTAPQGTPGYLDPEYHQCYHLTDKSDVYSFGVVLVELISSLPAVDVNRHRHEINLSNYAMNRIQSCAFSDLVDPQLGYESDFKVRRMTTLVAELSFQCLQHEMEFRPSMDEVLEALKRIESANYEEAEEMNRNNIDVGSKSIKKEASPTEIDGVGLLRSVQHPSSPSSVMQKWDSSSTTPNTSS